jgi:hypothetical protein
MYTKEELDFAYKYPFSDEAKGVIKALNPKDVEQRYLIIGKARVDEALENDKVEYRESDYGKLDFVVGYAYARMIVSALKNLGVITKYANAEAKRTADALAKDNDRNLIRVASELDLGIRQENGGFVMGFAKFLENAPLEEGFSLSNHRLSNGAVTLDRYQTIRVIAVAVAKVVAKGLPIKYSEIPKNVVEYSRNIKIPAPKVEMRMRGSGIRWIDVLLQTPIPDCRHRTVNLVLAPYLVNIKGLSVDKATETITNYITLCKTVNPDTRITEKYIRYQCEYAKKRGMKPMTLARAKTDLGSGIDFVLLLGEEEAVKQ